MSGDLRDMAHEAIAQIVRRTRCSRIHHIAAWSSSTQQKNAYDAPITAYNRSVNKGSDGRMQDKLRADKKVEPVLNSRSETELRSGSESVELLQPIGPEQLRRIPVREKAMAASTPGSEYWLP